MQKYQKLKGEGVERVNRSSQCYANAFQWVQFRYVVLVSVKPRTYEVKASSVPPLSLTSIQGQAEQCHGVPCSAMQCHLFPAILLLSLQLAVTIIVLGATTNQYHRVSSATTDIISYNPYNQDIPRSTKYT